MKKTLLLAGVAVVAVAAYVYMGNENTEMQAGEHTGMMDNMSNAASNMMQGAQDAATNAMGATQEMAGNAMEGAKDMADVEPAAGTADMEQQAKDAMEDVKAKTSNMMDSMGH